jgi:hypothetical protein
LSDRNGNSVAVLVVPRTVQKSPSADVSQKTVRAAYDALPLEMKVQLEGLRAHHSIAYSRQTLGFEGNKSMIAWTMLQALMKGDQYEAGFNPIRLFNGR